MDDVVGVFEKGRVSGGFEDVGTFPGYSVCPAGWGGGGRYG